MAEKDFKNHPELRPGEKWLTNSLPEHVSKMDRKTKRVGHTAYDVDGVAVPGLVPVFVQIKEKEQADGTAEHQE